MTAAPSTRAEFDEAARAGSVVSLAGVTRTDAALAGLQSTVERLRRLEAEADAAFRAYHAARERCREEGLTVDVELEPGVAAAFSEWKQRKMREEVRAEARS